MKADIKDAIQTEKSEAIDILGTLVVLNRGNTVVDMSREMQGVIDGVVATGKAGSITLCLKIKPSGIDQETMRPNQVEINPEISSKVPRRNQNKTTFFVTEANTITRDDPAQTKMFD
jgi:hypothetical protein